MLIEPLSRDEVGKGPSSTLMIETLLSIPENGISVLVNNTDKTFYIIHSTELLLSISKTIKELRTNVHRSRELQDAFNRNVLELKLLHTFEPGVNEMKIRAIATNECFKLERDGYRNLKKKLPGYYSIQVETLQDFRPILLGGMQYAKTFLVYVFARTKNFDKTPIAIFDTMYEAEEWLNKTYGERREHIIPQIADNTLTKNYYASKDSIVGPKFRQRRPNKRKGVEIPGN